MLANENKFMNYDVRLIKRHLASGKISKKELEQHLRVLEDSADQSEIIPLQAIFDNLPADEQTTNQSTEEQSETGDAS